MSLETHNIIIGRERNETEKSTFFTNRTFKGHVSFFNLSFHSDLTRLVLCTLKNDLLDSQTSYMLFMAQCKRVLNAHQANGHGVLTVQSEITNLAKVTCHILACYHCRQHVSIFTRTFSAPACSGFLLKECHGSTLNPIDVDGQTVALRVRSLPSVYNYV